MATEEGNSNLALFCDFENVALGVRDAKLKKIDIKLILERVLIKPPGRRWRRVRQHRRTR